MPTDSKLHLRIASPCKAPWENMDGDDRVRFCRECDRNVYDLSAMSEREARRLIAEREGRLCVRFYQRRDGTVLTSDCPVGAKRSFLAAGARSALTVAALASGLTSLAACEPAEDEPVHMGEPLMGSVAIQGDVEGDWDGGVGEHDEPDHPDRVIMGEIAWRPRVVQNPDSSMSTRDKSEPLSCASRMSSFGRTVLAKKRADATLSR